jgi:hypothetical protein
MWLVALTEKPFCRITFRRVTKRADVGSLDKYLFLSTINGYRSSITRTLAISGGTDFSNNEVYHY